MAPPPPPPPPGPPPPPTMPAFSAAPSGQQRDMLLQSIRQGTKLKKTVTHDKSGPFIAGKVQGAPSGNVSADSSRDAACIGPKFSNMNGGPPGFGNLFAGGMPKLKPTGLTIGSSMTSVPGKEGSTPRPLLSDTKSRGPPPQPPPNFLKPQISTSASNSVSTPLHNQRPNPPTVLPSKPPVGGYGKPNVAPKPPVAKEPVSSQASFSQSQNSNCLDQSGNSCSAASQIDQAKPAPPPKKITVNGRPGVNRAQSMRVPKSPPVAPSARPPFPPNDKNNLVKNQSSLHQSQGSLNGRNFMASKTGTLPHNFQKMALFPPNNPPPPAPNQPRTFARPPASRPPTRPAPPPAPPPPPPHRTFPAPPPPPLQGKMSSASSSNSIPPAPPVRNLSVRNGSMTFQTELENKLAHLFHSVREFPEPGVFRNLVKNYNTKASANAKQPAPPPPAPSTIMQLDNKLWQNNTSNC